MSFLTDEALQEIAARVFARRESTLEDEGRAVGYERLVQTVKRVRHRMNTTVETLPPHAFDPQPDDEDGNEVWNAGQIVKHISESQANFTQALNELVGLTREPQLEDLAHEDELSMPDTKGAIKTATAILMDTFKSMPEEVDLEKTMDHPRFGTLGVQGWLMLVAIHEHDHVNQLRDLA